MWWDLANEIILIYIPLASWYKMEAFLSIKLLSKHYSERQHNTLQRNTMQ